MIQLFKSIAFLSLIQTVFSKRSADTLQYYFGTSKASVQSNVGNAYRIRKHGLAFVQSRTARYLNSKSEQVYSAVSSTGTTKRNLFSLSFGNVVQRDVKETKQIQKVAEGMNNIANDKGSSLNGDIFGLSSWAKGLVSTKELSRAKSTDERNWFDTDIKTTKVSDLSSWAKRTLFHRFESVQSIPSADFHHVSKQGAVNAQLAGAIYQDMIPSVPILGHSMVVKGTSADVKWMVTDSIGYNSDFEPTSHQETGVPTIIRTITIRGFDASDEDVDRERLVTEICNAGKVPLTDDLPGLQVHRGLLAIAKEIYEDIKPFIDLAGPTHKIVLNGHSIGGALANLILMLMTVERGSIFVQEKINRVYTFGSPPIAKTDPKIGESNDSSGMYDCSVLEALGLPSDIVFGFVNPWDPIVRLFSPIDALYPLIGDLDEDGVTVYANGPPRTLRPIVRAILESWEKWPRFRDNNKDVMKQDYMSMGVQHLLMPDRGRFLSDRILAVDMNSYPVDDVLRVSSRELYGALEEAFPLDVFSISIVPVAIRSFVHHFCLAYENGFDHYVKKEEKMSNRSLSHAATPKQNTSNYNIVEKEIEAVNSLLSRTFGFDFADYATTWVLGA